MRRQYLAIKKQFPDTILFFRLGDFYETFDDDARIVSEVCDVVLTSRPVGADERVPLAGVPYHSVDPHIARLVAAGYKVAIAEQIGSEPPPGEKLVERTVRRVITAGTIVEPAMLEEGRNNYLAAIAFSTQRADRYGQSAAGPEHSTLSIGLAYADITTGEFAATELAGPEALRLLQEELARLQPAEVLVAEWQVQGRKLQVARSEAKRMEVAGCSGRRGAGIGTGRSMIGWTVRSGCLLGWRCHELPAWRFEEETARQALLEQFEVETLAAFGCDHLPQAVRAAGALVQYLRETQRATLPQLVSLRVYSTDEFMTLDQATRRNLELTQTIRGANKKGSLLGVLDATRTPMGSRLLRRWLHQPLLDMDKLTKRLDAVQSWHDDLPTRAELRALLRQIGDLERWTNRAAQGIARPQDLVGVRQALELLPDIERLQNLRKLTIVNCQSLRDGSQLSIDNFRMSSICCRLPLPRNRRLCWKRAA